MKRRADAVWSGGLKDGKPDSIATTATVALDQTPSGFTVTSSHLHTTVKIANADEAAFQKAVEAAKSGCPISKLLNAKITMDAKLA
jgi:osmotically inducible protein OsmC